MVIPTCINICGVPHRVILKKDHFSADAHFGEIDYTNAVITINEDMPPEMQSATICHEWLHGALVMLGYDDLTSDEKFVSALAAAINATFMFKIGRTE